MKSFACKRLVFILSTLLIYANNSFAKVIETSDSAVIRKEILSLNEEDLVTFDVKGVLFTPQDQVLSPLHVPHFK